MLRPKAVFQGDRFKDKTVVEHRADQIFSPCVDDLFLDGGISDVLQQGLLTSYGSPCVSIRSRFFCEWRKMP